MQLKFERLASLASVDPAHWNALAGDSPFLRYEFLYALERTRCIGPGTPWQPCYLVAEDAAGLAAAVPLYMKYDSHGEFVFDWGWADAYERAGRSYYPKLVAAVPFTPASGARLLTRTGLGADTRTALAAATHELAIELDVSSLHVLFPTDSERQLLANRGFLVRKDCQFHWANDSYADFTDFLTRFSAEKRKKAKRERRRVAEAGIVFEHLRGDEPTEAEWDAVFEFHARTFSQRGRAPYLNRAFFAELVTTMPENIVVILARHAGRPIAAAICFRSASTLYGRYWGSAADFHSLHFETCYYQGIDYCIRERLARFEPGTQGEHKIARGFTPTPTWSCHWLKDGDFHSAVAAFLQRETRHVDAYIGAAGEHVPYRRDAWPSA